MHLEDIVMVAGDTARSRCYIQALRGVSVLPRACVLLPSRDQARPGQVGARSHIPAHEASWGVFDPNAALEQTCRQSGVDLVHAPDRDINAPGVVALLRGIEASAFIYSGFGGVLLRSEVLGCGKPFLHVHGGWLPEYKGSTTNHYSLLEEGFCGASAIFLTENIDSGKILWREKFQGPADLQELDLVLDSVFRAEVLCRVMRHYEEHGRWPDTGVENAHTEHYYVMHPVLRHVLLLGGGRGRGA